MRRRTLLLTAGLSAYFIGASVNAYLWQPACSYDELTCRVAVVAEHPRAAFFNPIRTIDFLITGVASE